MAGANPQIGSIQQAAPNSGTFTPSDAHGQTYVSAGQGLKDLGTAVGDVETTQDEFNLQRAQAGQNMWLTQAKSNAELQAQSIAETAQRSAQPGQPAMPQAQKDWDTHVNEQLDSIDNPLLKAKLSDQLSTVGASLGKTMQKFDYDQQDAYVVHNLNQTVNNKAALYQTMTDRDAIAGHAQSDLGELTSNIMSLPIPPDKRMELLDKTRKGIVISAMDARTAIDPVASLTENAPARSPEAFRDDPNVPRGVRNNNPFNLEGNLGFQGQSGTDDKNYATFESAEAGLRAGAINLRNQQDVHGLNTVADIVTKYAPPSENNTAAYINNVAGALGVKPDDKIDLHDPQVLAKFMQATIKQENGASSYSSKQIMHAAQTAVDPDNAGAAPGATTSEGGARTGDPLFSLLTPEEQQTQIQHMESVYRQQQYFSRQSGSMANSILSQYEPMIKQGVPIAADKMQELQGYANDAKSPFVQQRFQRAVLQNQALQDFTPMAPQQLTDYLQKSLKPVIDSGKATPADAERYNIGVSLLKSMNEQIKTDPISAFQRTSSTPMPDITQATPDAFQARAAYAGSASNLYGTPYKAFTPAELPRLKATFDEATPMGKRALLTNLAIGFGDKTPEAATQIFGKESPEIAYAATMLATPNLSEQQAAIPMGIVAGQTRINNDKDKVLPINKVDSAMQNMGYDSVLPPGSSYDNGKAAARALFASRVNSAQNLDTDTVQKAVTDVMGPIVSANGTKTIPPYGVDGSAFSKFVEHISPEQFQTAVYKGQGDDTAGLPKNDDGDFDPSRDKLRLKPIANGLYQMVDRNNKPYLTGDKKGFAVLKIEPGDVK